MADTTMIRNPEYFENYHLYTRTIDRDSENYKNLVEEIKREPDVVYPEGWRDFDIDRLIVGDYCVHHGVEEYKHIDNLNQPYKFNQSQRKEVKKYLTQDHFKIEYLTTNFSHDDRIGAWKEEELNINPVELKYSKYLKQLSDIKKTNKTLGKGVCLYVIYTHNLEFFSVINLTNSQYVLKQKKLESGGNDLKIYLEKVSEIIEPCFNELLKFMLEAYVRGDFEKLYNYLTDGVDKDLLRLSDNELILAEGFKEIGETVPLWLALTDTMEWLMKCIHFDTILEESVSKKSVFFSRYKKFARHVQEGSIFNHMAEMINERHEYYKEKKVNPLVSKKAPFNIDSAKPHLPISTLNC